MLLAAMGTESSSFICREEFAKALMLDRQLAAAAKATSTEPPTLAMCSSVALAAALPFVGFGFLDNFIMVRLRISLWSFAIAQRHMYVCGYEQHA